jgi:hypothetical protein
VLNLRGKYLNSGIRGGLWEDAHLQRIGPAVWLFGWLIHRQTRERHGVGLVLGGSALTYEIISQDTGMAVRTLKRWMARLIRGGYVRVTHGVHKRMIIEIAKAKKFGPQQLGFPQKQFAFPQPPFFAPNSKGPLLALETASKGPLVAQQNQFVAAQAPVNAATCEAASAAHREFNSERKETNARPGGDFTAANHHQAPRVYPISINTNPKALRDLRLRSELRVGAGPEIHRE